MSKSEFVCTAVESFYAINITLNSVDVGWTESPEAIEYSVNYRLFGDTSWLAVSVADDDLASLYSLDTCSGYEFFIITICNDFTEISSDIDSFYTSCDTLGSSIFPTFMYDNRPHVIYPNPTSGELNIQFNEAVYGEVILRIYDAGGILYDESRYHLNGETKLENILYLDFLTGLNYVRLVYNEPNHTSRILLIE